jgi:cytochrome c biogenesis protein CcmG, thiol:disulfide interchange protein DsbE
MRIRLFDATVPTAIMLAAALAFGAAHHADAVQDGSQDAAKEAAAPPADPAAATAVLKKIMDAYRDPRGVEIAVSTRVGASRDGRDEFSEPIEAKFLFTSGRRAIVSLRGFDLRLADGKITATHGSNPLTYLQVSDHDSPYYSLFNAFQSLPFPELGLALGEDDPTETCMQLMPQIPNVVPTRLEKEEVDGQVSDVLVLVSDDASEELRLAYDPETHFVERATGVLQKGDLVEGGSKLMWIVSSKVTRPKETPTDATFALDTASRQKVDGLAALVDARKEAEEDKEVEALKAGDPAPELALPRLGAGDWNLIAERPKPVVIDFFATWCGPCRAALPELARLQKDFEGRATVLLVNSAEQGTREEREARIKELLDPFAAKGTPFECVLDLDSMASRRWLVRAFPTTFLVAPDGRLAGVWIGASPSSQRELRQKLEELCAKPAVAPEADAPKAEPVAPKPAGTTP